MIIISSGFPKSASTYLFLCTESLIEHSGCNTGQKLFRKVNKEGFTPHIGVLNGIWYIILSIFGPIVVKTHCGPTGFVRLLINLKLAKAYYSVRDPRDVVISALDHGRKARSKKTQDASDRIFSNFKTIADLIPSLRMHFNRYIDWKKYGRVWFVRYEDAVSDAETVLNGITEWLGVAVLKSHVPSVVSAFEKQKTATKNFNTGKTDRYITEMSQENRSQLEHEFSDMFRDMGYPTQA